MKRIILIGFLALLISGCITTKPNPILTSSEESWYIPQGTKFEAKKKLEETLKTYIAEDDLIVLYFGKYLELEKQANSCSR